MLVMSREANEEVGVMGVRCSSLISSVVLFMLKEFGSGAIFVIFDVKILLICMLGHCAS
jgi:hypothetical protein